VPPHLGGAPAFGLINLPTIAAGGRRTSRRRRLSGVPERPGGHHPGMPLWLSLLELGGHVVELAVVAASASCARHSERGAPTSTRRHPYLMSRRRGRVRINRSTIWSSIPFLFVACEAHDGTTVDRASRGVRGLARQQGSADEAGAGGVRGTRRHPGGRYVPRVAVVSDFEISLVGLVNCLALTARTPRLGAHRTGATCPRIRSPVRQRETSPVGLWCMSTSDGLGGPK
jgi:hypothetical protein